MRVILTILITSVLIGCTTPARVEEGTARSVVIAFGTDGTGLPVGSPTLSMAEAHCKKFGKSARYSGRPTPTRIAYDCVD